MTRRQSGMVWHLWLVATAAVLSVAACGGTSSGGTGAASPTVPSSSATVASNSPTAAPPTPPSSADIAASKSACKLISSSAAAAALGMAVGVGRPVPGVSLSNGAIGGSCEFSDSAGGTAIVVTLKYPSSAIARTVFNRSKGVTAISQPVHLPDLGQSEFADTDTYGGTRIAQGFVLDGNRELNVTISEPASGPGSRFSLPAFVTLVRQAARAWR